MTVNLFAGFDVHPDGRRFLIKVEAERPQDDSPQINVLTNWQALLKR